jgi:hypothetical protein
MKRVIVTIAMCLVLAGILSGCTFARQKINIQGFHEKAESIIPGTTKADELDVILGSPPNAILPIANDNQIYLYSFGQGKTCGLNLILLQIQKTIIGFDTGYFLIDKDKIVKEKVVSTNSTDIPWRWWAFGE